MDAERLEEIREQAERRPRREYGQTEAFVDVLLAEVERLRGVVEAELLRHDPNPQGAERRRRMTCEICSEIDRSEDGIWACSAGARLSAALADEAKS